ncbi:MAG: thioredoxin family protein [Alistipes sp.]|jgi:thiol:disulfide interchange protein DsbD|nr:thioredoxin family protein [Alistipes sp.]
MRRRFAIVGALLCALLWASGARAQEAGGTEWSATATPVDGGAGEWEVRFEARPTRGWHLYDLGPYGVPSLATGFDFSASRGLETVGGPFEATEPAHEFDPVFGFETGYYEIAGVFAQRVKVLEPGAVLAGEVEYQICNDDYCVRGVWEFSVPVGAAAAGAAGTEGTPAADLPAVGAPPADLSARNAPDGESLWGMVLSAAGWALLALLTPCVFPMIPMTVTFFLKDNSDPAGARLRASMFGVFTVVIFTVPVAALILAARFGGGEAVSAGIFNWLATHWVPNVLFFAVFMLFAASLLGAFEIRLPSRWLNRSDRNADRAGMAGAFFLALTLVLVSFSCTVPIVGTAIIQSVGGEFWRPIATMLVFSTVFALPFTFFAFFPRIMERMPRSGGWLGEVKAMLGLAEIALGLKFLSVADQTYHWGILDREVYLAIWIVVFSIAGLYLSGRIRFKYDAPLERMGVGRLGLVIAVFSFVVYLVPGMWGAPLKGISGYLPPMSTQDFIYNGHSPITPLSNYAPSDEKIKYADILRLPHGLAGYFDLEQGLAAARAAGKPVFLDFTGHGCVNCREMEARVWVDPEVQRILSEEYIVIALYSDDRTRLPESEWLTTPAGKELKTIGRKNSYTVNTRYGVSAQPAYMLLDGEGELLAPVYGYSLDVAKYVEFLRGGMETFKNPAR